ncbi:MAG: cytochrome c biogenesis protein CcsA [Trueperaceae bacterium]
MTNAQKRPMWLTVFGLVTLVLFGVGAYLGLVVSPPDYQQGELFRITYAHVSVVWVCFLASGVAAVFGMLYLWRSKPSDDLHAVAHTESALVFALLTIIGGMTYSKPTLGVYWDWEPRLTLTALLLALLVGYFVVRGLIDDPVRKGRVSAVVSIIILVSLPFNWMATVWFRTLHPNKSLQITSSGVEDSMDPTMRWILLFNVVVAALIYTYFVLERVRIGRIEAKLQEQPEPKIKGEVVHV